MFLGLLLIAQAAFAWYDPSTQRWLTRDPIGEPGFETLRMTTAMPTIGIQISRPSARWITRDLVGKLGGDNLYEFVQNRPTTLHDANGLIAFPTACEAAKAALAAAYTAWLADQNNQAALEAYQAAFAAMIAACNPPPEMPPSSPNCPVMPKEPSNPYQNNQSAFCATHPAICRSAIIVGIGIGIGIGVCEVCPICCAALAF